MTAVAVVVRPAAIDCPPCPKCGGHTGTPASLECGVEPGRWYGPDNATLFCPACGTGWVGTVDDSLQAARAWIAYEEADTRITLDSLRRWLTRARTVAPGLTNSEIALVERLISDLEAG
jgi:hypothetical protein